MSDGGTAGNAAHARRVTATDPGLDEVLRAAGFEVTNAGRQRWRALLARPVPQATVEAAQRLLDRVRGRAA
jgi:hypothetical protein